METTKLSNYRNNYIVSQEALSNYPTAITCIAKAGDIPKIYSQSDSLSFNISDPLPLANSVLISSGIVANFEGVKIPKDAKTVLDTSSSMGLKVISLNDKLNKYVGSSIIIPHIENIQVIEDKVVIVLFKDGTREKVVLDDTDTYSLEQGISICITKKMLSMMTNGNGSSAYNKLIKHCLKVYENNRKAEEKVKLDEQAAKEKEKKAADKARAKRIKKANKNREREIEIQKEAYLRAMKEFGGNSAVND